MAERFAKVREFTIKQLLDCRNNSADAHEGLFVPRGQLGLYESKWRAANGYLDFMEAELCH